MLISIYMTFTISAFILLILGLLLKPKDRTGKGHTMGVRVMFPIIAGIIFGVLAFASMNVTVPACSGQINSSIAINSSDTTYTSEILCEDQNYRDIVSSSMFIGLAAISMLIGFVKMFTGGVDYAGQQMTGKPPTGGMDTL